MISRPSLSPALARSILDRMGATGQPPERGALAVNVGTDTLLEALRDEYFRPIRESRRNSTFKLIQATFGGGKTQFLHALRELAWGEGFATALVGLSPKECPFDQPVRIYQEVARRMELPVVHPEQEPSRGFDALLDHVAEERVDENGADAFREWLATEFVRWPIESRSFARAVRAYLEAAIESDVDKCEVLGDYLLGERVSTAELEDYRLRETLEEQNAFLWLRSLVQVASALNLPGVVLLFDEMDRNMSLSVGRRRAIGDNLRQMIDYCGQAQLPGVVWCYAVPPEFMTTIVPEYPALAQRLKGAGRFGGVTPLQPIIDLEQLPLAATEMLRAIGMRLLELAGVAFPEASFDREVQAENVVLVAHELGARQLESGTRRQFVKAIITLFDAQRRSGQKVLTASEVRTAVGSAERFDVGSPMPDEQDF
ncbi:MAG: BREX system ATP-binding domain-containing protein [Planctomycetota bacterium]